jgi:hypothetical protein
MEHLHKAEVKGGEGEKDKKEGEEDKKEGEGEEKGLNLFATTGVRRPEYWQCICYITPLQEKENWTAGDATSVFCTHCKAKIKYNAIKNNKGIKWHSNKCHPKSLQNFKRKQASDDGGSNKKKKIGYYFPTQGKEEKMLASQSNQMKFHQLVALWTALSLCPFSILEDVKWQELVQFVSNVHGELKMPRRNTNKKNIIHAAKVLKQAIRNDMKSNCSYFACTSDMWSSTQMKAFRALTLHFLTDDFCMQSYTLEVKPTQGKLAI